MDYLQYLKIVQQDNNLILVLNLIINGLPSIFHHLFGTQVNLVSFKPYYKWITFNIDKSSYDKILEIQF